MKPLPAEKTNANKSVIKNSLKKTLIAQNHQDQMPIIGQVHIIGQVSYD